MGERELSLLAFDPGGTTGAARVWIPASALRPDGNVLRSMEFEAWQIGGTEREQGRKIAVLLAEYTGPVVIESFRLRQFRQDNDLLAPVRMIARIEQTIDILVNWGPVLPKPTFYQEPSLAKSTANDSRMRRWGLWSPGQPHANDAMRHAVTFLRRCKSDKKLINAAFTRQVG